MKSRTQCSVPSAESYGALPAEASPVVSRETSPSPRETAAMPPTPVRQRTLSRSDLPCFSNRRHPICLAQSRRICHVHTRQQQVASRRARRIYGRPLPGTGRRHQVTPHVLRHTPYPPPRRERASRLISSLKSQLLRSVTSAESHGALPSDASPLVSRETDSQPRRGRHGSADVIPRSALPG